MFSLFFLFALLYLTYFANLITAVNDAVPLTKRLIVTALLVDATSHQPVTVDVAQKYASEKNLIYIDSVGALSGYYMFESYDRAILRESSQDSVCQYSKSLNVLAPWQTNQVPQTRWRQPLPALGNFKKRADERSLSSNYKQWHIFNNGTHFPRGNDLNVAPVWRQQITGKGVTIAVIDDGLDYKHPYIEPNYVAEYSYNFLYANSNPKPINRAVHGTRCAGEIAAVSSSQCGSGVAYEASIVAGLLLDGNARDAVTLDAIEASALTRNFDKIDIYSNSWGPSDAGDTIEGPGTLTSMALTKGVDKGRKGLGSIYIFASGNGGQFADNCNMDGYANSIYTISIGGIDGFNRKTEFSEICSAQLAVGYAGTLSPDEGLVTTENQETGSLCTNEFAGTSSSAPNAAGIVALALQLRPDLGWRDVQHVIAKGAAPFDLHPEDGAWSTNSAGLSFHPYFGFGKLDAEKIIETARVHVNVPYPLITVQKSVEPNAQLEPGKKMTFYISVMSSDLSILRKIEHVQVAVWTTAVPRALMSVNVTSPSGTESILMTKRPKDAGMDLNGWKLDSVNFWGESPKGNWKVAVELDSSSSSEEALLSKLELLVHGSCAHDTAQKDSRGRWRCGYLVEAETRLKRTIALSLVACAFSLVLLSSVAILVYRKMKAHPRDRVLFKLRQPLMLATSFNDNLPDVDPTSGAPPSSSVYSATVSAGPAVAPWQKIWNFLGKNTQSSAGYTNLELQDVASPEESLPSASGSSNRPGVESGAFGNNLKPLVTSLSIPKGRAAFSVGSPLTPGLLGAGENGLTLFQQQQMLLQQQQQKGRRFSSLVSPVRSPSRNYSNLAKLSIGSSASNAQQPGHFAPVDEILSDEDTSTPSPSKLKAFNFNPTSKKESLSQSLLAATTSVLKKTVGLSGSQYSSQESLIGSNLRLEAEKNLQSGSQPPK